MCLFCVIVVCRSGLVVVLLLLVVVSCLFELVVFVDLRLCCPFCVC